MQFEKGDFCVKEWIQNRQDGSAILQVKGTANFPVSFVYAHKSPSPFFCTYPTKDPLLNRQMINLLSLAYAEYS